MTIGAYSINGCCGYSINGFLWIFCLWLLVVILLIAIGGYSINGYCGYSINGFLWIFC
jgi:hypothetical protein